MSKKKQCFWETEIGAFLNIVIRLLIAMACPILTLYLLNNGILNVVLREFAFLVVLFVNFSWIFCALSVGENHIVFDFAAKFILYVIPITASIVVTYLVAYVLLGGPPTSPIDQIIFSLATLVFWIVLSCLFIYIADFVKKLIDVSGNK